MNTQAWLSDMCGYERVSRQTAKLLGPAGDKSTEQRGQRAYTTFKRGERRRKRRRKRDVPCVMVEQGRTAMAKTTDSGYMEKDI